MSVINAETLADVPVTSVTDLLQGNAPGVTISSTTGQPGSTAEVRIRGMGSINASKSPLYVIDGVPMYGGSIGASSSASSSQLGGGLDPLSTISPSDIENIAVIKDAAAASLWGSRAANGVIVITTKSGKPGKATISAKIDAGFTDFAYTYREMMNGDDRAEAYTAAIIDASTRQTGKTPEDYIAENMVNVQKPWSGWSNWDDALFQKGFFQNYELSVAGGDDKFRYYSSVSYTDQEGVVVKQSNYDRLSARVNVDFNATKWLTIGTKSMFSKIDQDVYSEGTAYSSPFYSSKKGTTPSDAIYNEDGSFNQYFLYSSVDGNNPLASLTYNTKTNRVTRYLNTYYGEVTFLPELKFRSTLTYDFILSQYDSWSDERAGLPGAESSRSYYQYKRETTTSTNMLSYIKSFGRHNVDASAGYEAEQYNREYRYSGVSGFLNPDMNAIGNGSTPTGVNGYDQGYRMASIITRANYDYDNKYYFGVSFRNDRSSRLPKSNRSANFWSVSGSWRINNEAFMENVGHIFHDLKLRASYGTNGTLPSDYYEYMGATSLNSSYMENNAMIIDRLANPNLGWEKNKIVNVGIDMGFIDRIDVSFEYFNRVTDGLLYSKPLSRTTGFSSQLMNIGKIRNHGVELVINSRNIIKKDFSWTTSFNLGHVKNKLMTLDGELTETTSTEIIHRVGLPYYTYYVYEFAGIDPADGDPMFYLNTKNADGSINRNTTKIYSEAERIAYKSYDPTIEGGLNNTFKYKWFDLSFLFGYQFGGYTYDYGATKVDHGGGDLTANIPKYYKDRWQKPGDISKYEKLDPLRTNLMSDIHNSRRIHSSDMIKLRNLTVGFSLPSEWARKVKMAHIRIYCAGSNIWTWAAYKDYDPESASQSGRVDWSQPPMKTWTFGLDLKF